MYRIRRVDDYLYFSTNADLLFLGGIDEWPLVGYSDVVGLFFSSLVGKE